MNVIIANNGAGKSSLLDAITVVLSPYAHHFEHGDVKNIKPQDATLLKVEISTAHQIQVHGPRVNSVIAIESQYPVRIASEIELPEEHAIAISRELTSAKGRTTNKEADELLKYAKKIKSILDNHDKTSSAPLPVISYYGTGRLHAQKRLTEKKKLGKIHNTQSRTMGYLDCLSPESSYKHFEQWMKKTTLAKLQESDPDFNHSSADIYDHMLKGVSKTINIILADLQWKDLHYNVQLEKLYVSDETKRIPLESLSDGVRSAIAMIGDLAYRCIMLNPQLAGDAPALTPGIVLIDEIEMHLHPSWQQKIIGQLQEAFPAIQFICTTHSPQVLSTVKPESIQLIQDDECIENGKDLGISTYGTRSNFVLEDLMQVSPDPSLPEVERLKENLKLKLSAKSLSLEDDDLLELERMIGSRSPFIRNVKSKIIKQSNSDA